MDEYSEGGSPQSGRRYGVQVMGSGLLAEMKAKQEKRAAGAHKVPDSSPSPDRPEGGGAVKGPPTPAESRAAGVAKAEGATGSPEKTPRTLPAGPKPPIQGTKPPLAARPAIPQKPRTSSSRSVDEGSDSPGGNVSPKTPVLPHPMKRAMSDKERDSPGGVGSRVLAQEGRLLPWWAGSQPQLPQVILQTVDLTGDGSPFDSDPEPDKPAAPTRLRAARQYSASTAEEAGEQERRKSFPQPVRPASVSDSAQRPSASRHNSEDSCSKAKDKSPSKDNDRTPGAKSTDSGEEVDKDFIFI
ncbi:hypothetical protein AGOR_G00113380 [Albula goreensis]|uniref:Uncharacterized protein n=1 Tax=Albula goreensis TaxID=1534307 RepID=A0A8T3DDA2_9TELE|nr:hypothetical protein AGOR_G00113380 [Albula goreensis]